MTVESQDREYEILRLLSILPMTFTSIKLRTKMVDSVLYHHLKNLEKHNLITNKSAWRTYRLTAYGIKQFVLLTVQRNASVKISSCKEHELITIRSFTLCANCDYVIQNTKELVAT